VVNWRRATGSGAPVSPGKNPAFPEIRHDPPQPVAACPPRNNRPNLLFASGRNVIRAGGSQICNRSRSRGRASAPPPCNLVQPLHQLDARPGWADGPRGATRRAGRLRYELSGRRATLAGSSRFFRGGAGACRFSSSPSVPSRGRASARSGRWVNFQFLLTGSHTVSSLRGPSAGPIGRPTISSRLDRAPALGSLHFPGGSSAQKSRPEQFIHPPLRPAFHPPSVAWLPRDPGFKLEIQGAFHLARCSTPFTKGWWPLAGPAGSNGSSPSGKGGDRQVHILAG